MHEAEDAFHCFGWGWTSGANGSVTPALSRGPSGARLRRMKERQPCAYILASGFYGTLYVGVTSNLAGRMIQHREGTLGGFTHRYHVTHLVWYDMADTMEDAIVHEKRLKRWRRDWKIELIERDNPRWDDLAIGLGLPPLRENR